MFKMFYVLFLNILRNHFSDPLFEFRSDPLLDPVFPHKWEIINSNI